MAQRENNKLPKVSKSRTARTSNDLQLNNCRTYKINDGLQFIKCRTARTETGNEELALSLQYLK